MLSKISQDDVRLNRSARHERTDQFCGEDTTIDKNLPFISLIINGEQCHYNGDLPCHFTQSNGKRGDIIV